ncbi:MAG: hypothetical protein K8I03_11845 [Ignavibacteria bacterium]|nr:hypothetical protein [Ignavibacteria bacterium]
MNKLSIIICLLMFIETGFCEKRCTYGTNHLSYQGEPFNDFLERFISTFNEKNSAEIDKCISTEFGFFVLDNPGAFVIAEHFESFDDIMKLEGEYNIGYLKKCKVSCVFAKGKIPVYNCDNNETEGWNKNGCFYNDNQTLSVTEVFKKMLEFNLGDNQLVKKNIEQAAKSEKYITHLAYSTEGSIGFYFGLVEEQWRLICIDKITPCSA